MHEQSKVKDIMCKNVYKVTKDSDIQEVCECMEKNDIGCVPVCDENNCCCGIITDRDVVVRCDCKGKDVTETQAKDVMTDSVTTIHPDASITEATEAMKEHKVRRLPVVEENGKVVGILSLGDIAQCGCYDKQVGECECDICRCE